MRQVYYSANNKRSIDLVFFVNGLPVATAELKTDFTQSVQDAITQYKSERTPKDPETRKAEPLLGFGYRALVHFAVSNDEVFTTTKLDGAATRFLPFNMGFDGGQGNPPNSAGSRTSYLWERVLQRDSWLDILGKFMHVESRDRVDAVTKATSRSTTLLFPRFHQWEAVTELVAAAKAEGPGGRYLIQHSAGSGKTNSIAWTAHRLATLHDDENQKVFQSVIVVTDRTVLDDQLQEAIGQAEQVTGVVVPITDEQARKTMGDDGKPLTSKSKLLAKCLVDGTLVIVVTIQTFPFALEEIRKAKGLSTKRFAVIADEAHSSQTGATANKLKEVLTTEEQAELADGGEIDTEALLAAQMVNRAAADNISYFAFTATPKPKTIELFGREDADGLPRAFHTYTMQQAIQEGFILDVLRNYTPYDTAFQIAQQTVDGDETLVDEAAATLGLMRWVKLHPTNIAQKVQIIVEHFRSNVESLLDGNAKAMIVTDSRKAAVRYKKAIDAYIAKQGYTEVTTLVAFSGDVTDLESGPEPFNEQNLNPLLRGRDLRAAFATHDYRVMLVANKFQTGFDQPLLVAMYVDKQLSGVTAVQTLSRLNRTYPGKDVTFVLDFVNKPELILAAFQPYYKEARLDTVTDPNVIHDLQAKLDLVGIYTDAEIDAFADAWVQSKGNNALAAAIDPAKQRFKDRWDEALRWKNQTEIETLELFRDDLNSFVRMYDFLSQIIDYGDTDLEKRSIFFRMLARRIKTENLAQPVDISDVELRRIKQAVLETVDIALDPTATGGLSGITAAGSRPHRDPKLVRLEEIVLRLNEMFADEEFSQGEKTSWLEGLLTVLLGNQMLVNQARINSKSQFLDSPDLRSEVIGVLLGNQESHSQMFDIVTASDRLQVELVTGLGELLYEHAHLEDNPESVAQV
ncbi:MAG: DEAD/DEAH box helicase family protein [Actinomycetota bacterium]|nr:DEAD/DEAH box helicase family protein [Actinomycetota bacterium]